MSLKEQLKQEVTTEKEKFKQMSFSDKLWYIGEYYKFHILAVVIVLVLIGTIGSTVRNNLYYEDVLYGYVLNNRSETPLDPAPFEQGFAESMGYDDRHRLTLESSYVSYGDDATEFSYATMAKISALVASKDLDFMIMDEENFNHYMEMPAFLNLEEFLPDDLLQAAQGRLIYAADPDGITHAYAISLDGTAFANDMNLSEDCQYFGILSNTGRGETVSDLLRYILLP